MRNRNNYLVMENRLAADAQCSYNSIRRSSIKFIEIIAIDTITSGLYGNFTEIGHKNAPPITLMVERHGA